MKYLHINVIASTGAANTLSPPAMDYSPVINSINAVNDWTIRSVALT